MEQQPGFEELCREMHHFVEERNWEQFHTPKNLAMSITIEAAELMEHFQWLTNEQSVDLIAQDPRRSEIIDEIADILLYCLSFMHILDVDISHAILNKLERNKERYPIGTMPVID
jgi:NTP pyrophosphatase (non-canonical NTP hydrolase)